jgi:hypothetical protein
MARSSAQAEISHAARGSIHIIRKAMWTKADGRYAAHAKYDLYEYAYMIIYDKIL